MSLNKLFEKYDLISLGHNCYPKLFTDTIIEKETQLFDYSGSSTWSIIKLLENNFENILNKKLYYYPNKTFKPHNPYYNITHKEYYLRFVHDGNFLENNISWNTFQKKLSRRLNRFIELLKSNKPLLFFYLEENTVRFDRLYPEIEQYYPKNTENYAIEQSALEQARMFDIVNLIKTMHQKQNFKIIYFSHLLDKTYYKDNILFIKTSCHYNQFSWQEWPQQYSKLIKDNYDYIDEILNK
jgi:hypothetical protein